MFLEMRFCDAFGVPEKPVFTRLFDLFATDMLANFQDRLVMTTSITLRKYDATACIIFTEFLSMWLGELRSTNPLRIPPSEIDKLACQAQSVGIFAAGELSR